MKRWALLIVLATTLLISVGCGQDNSAVPRFIQEDLSLTIDGAQYRCNMNIDIIIADLGTDYDYTEGMSCDYDGLDKTYLYNMAVFYTNPLSEGDLINEIYTENPEVYTSKGISAGATKFQVLAAYGEENCEDLESLLIYSLPGERASLCFELDQDDVVWAIYLTTQSV